MKTKEKKVVPLRASMNLAGTNDAFPKKAGCSVRGHGKLQTQQASMSELDVLKDTGEKCGWETTGCQTRDDRQ